MRAGRRRPRPRRSPRRAASARFSATVIVGAVPLNGFWNTRPIMDARRCSGQRVTSFSAMLIVPRYTYKLPATALSSVDFPEPFVPMTMTNEPSSMSSDTPRRERTSFGVPSKNVLRSSRTCSMSLHFLQRHRQHERAENEDRGHQFQVVRIESPAQRERDDQSKKHRAHDRADERGADAVGADQRAADDHARQSPHNHADAHLHIGESLVLREERAGECDQSVRDAEPEDDHVLDADAERADHLFVVARRAHRAAEVRVEEEPGDERDDQNDRADDDQRADVARAHRPTEERGGVVAGDLAAEVLRVGGDGGDGEERQVARAHHVQIDRVERGHHQDAGEQLIDLEARVQHAGADAGEAAGDECGDARGDRMHAAREQRGCGRGAEGDGAVGGDVGEAEDAIADVDAEGEKREDQSDGPRGEEQRHAMPPSAIGKTQHAPRWNSDWPAPSIARASFSRCTTESTPRGWNDSATVGPISSLPRGSERNAVTAAWKCPLNSSLIGRRNGASVSVGFDDATPTTRLLKRANSRSGVNDIHSRTVGKSNLTSSPRAGERRRRVQTRPEISAT